MMTIAAPKLLILAKSDGQFKHSGKYFLQGGRWHKLHADKVAPKGAPVAAKPHAAGQHKPHVLTPEQVEQLKYPAEKAATNSEMASFNDKHLPELLGHAANGDATAILGAGYGTNTHSKKKATIANYLLEQMGSSHKVTPGQKQGEHHAVNQAEEQAAPATPVETQEPEAAAPDPQPELAADDDEAGPPPPLSMPSFAEGKTVSGVVAYYEQVAHKIIMNSYAGNVSALEEMKSEGLKPNAKGKISNTWAGKTANSKTLLALYDQAIEHSKSVNQNPVKDGEPTAAPVSEAAPAAEAEPVKSGAKAASLSSKHWLSQNGVSTHESQKLFGVLSADGTKAIGKNGKPSAWGKLSVAKEFQPHADQMVASGEYEWINVYNSSDEANAAHKASAKKEPRLVLPTKAPAAAPAPSADKVSQIPWDELKLPDSNTNAKTFNKKLAEIKAAAEAYDVDKLEAMSFGVNTYGKKAAKVAATAIAAIKEAYPAAAPATDKSAPSSNQSSKWSHDSHDNWLTYSDRTKTYMVEKKDSGYAVTDSAGKEDSFGSLSDLNSYLVGKFGAKAPTEVDLAKLDSPTPSETDGPKEGDTKQGADGMLVFKNGRWHKQKEAEPELETPTATEPTGLDAIQVPDFEALSPGKYGEAYKKLANFLLEAVKENGAAGLKGVVINHADGRYTVNAAGLKLKKLGPNGDGPPEKVARQTAMHKFITELKAAAGKPQKPSKPKAAPAPQAAAPASAYESMDAWEQTGPQGGSNPGGKFKDQNGVEWYCKFPADEDVAKSEVLAAKLYEALGVTAQDAKLVTKDGKVGIASKWQSVSKAKSPAALSKTDGVAGGFGADAWLGNWDVVGLGYDNLQVGADGKAMRVDAGGSLQYRAQGGKKAFGPTVTEIDSLRDKAINPQSASVFGKMTNADITASVAKVLKLSDATIFDLVMEHGPGDLKAKSDLIETLIARKADLAAKFPKAKPKEKKKPDPTNLKVTADQLSQRHDFANWNGPGKGLSSKEHVNAANAKAEKDLLDFALKGNLIALQDYHYDDIDKETGQVSGKKHIQEHPSKHVKEYWSDLVATLSYVAYPPEALKRFNTVVATSIKKVSDAFKSHAYGMTTAKAEANSRLAFWIAIGNTKPATALLLPGASVDFQSVPTGIPKMTSQIKSEAQAKYAALSSSRPVRRFINGIQSSGSYNDNFRDGLFTTKDGHNAVAMVKDAYEYASEKPEGFEIYKWLSFPKDMKQQILSAPEGTVFQNPGSMCCSYEPNATSGFGADRMRIRYAKGAKAVDSFGSGNFAGEKEITTLPGQRFVILSSKKVMCPVKGKERVELDVLMLPPDESYLAEIDSMKGTK